MTWEQASIEGDWHTQHKLEQKPETSFEKYHRESEEARNKAQKLGNELASGHRPMFMTGSEIKEHYAPFEGDKQPLKHNVFENESDQDLWNRKLTESKQTGLERHGEMSFAMGVPQRQGISKTSSLESVSKEQGIKGHASLEWSAIPGRKPQVFGGHHRIALAAEQFKDHVFPVKYSESIEGAQKDPSYR